MTDKLQSIGIFLKNSARFKTGGE